MRRTFLRAAGGLLLAAGAAPALRAAERKGHRIVLHVGSSDPALMKSALNNITAAHEAYSAREETLQFELVANGGGYTMLRADLSPVKQRLAEVHALYPAVVFSACQNSRRVAAEAESKAPGDIPQLPGVTDVTAGIVRLTDLQEQGWTYIRA